MIDPNAEKYPYYMHVCSKCGDDAYMMTKGKDCPQCGNTSVTVILNTEYKKNKDKKKKEG